MDEVTSQRTAGSDEGAGGSTAAGRPHDDDTTRKSYRYLRVSVVALALLLTTSLVLEIVRRSGEELGSISAYYYSPARSILVGALVATGPPLIAIKGRRGWEDVLLDLAGMVVPLVALVPASRDLGAGACGPDLDRCIPPDLVPAVQNNVTALLVLGAAGLVFAWWSAGRGAGRDRAATAGLVAATGVWCATVLWFWFGRAGFLANAHYVSAVVFFLLIAAVAFLNGQLAPRRRNVPLVAPQRYGQAYRTIGGLMVLTILTAAVLFSGSSLTGRQLWPSTTFVVEAVLMVLFVVFWTAQTVENWHEEAHEEARAGVSGGAAGTSRPPAP